MFVIHPLLLRNVPEADLICVRIYRHNHESKAHLVEKHPHMVETLRLEGERRFL